MKGSRQAVVCFIRNTILFISLEILAIFRKIDILKSICDNFVLFVNSFDIL